MKRLLYSNRWQGLNQDRKNKTNKTKQEIYNIYVVHVLITGYAITNKNPFDDRQLEQTLRNIEKEQRLKSTEMFWKQRQFFIEKAFDEDDKLR